ncbi:MAG: TMEM175 family protein [Rhodoferax sp.]
MNKNRLEAFSDGVIAIIITIMVLELRVPHPFTLENLLALAPVFLSYALSFVVIAIVWVNHHHLMSTARSPTGRILWLNNHMLFWLSLIPFSTGGMGENHLAPLAIAVYSLNLAASAVAYDMLRRGVAAQQPDNRLLGDMHRRSGRKNLMSIGLYLASAPLAYVSVWISIAIFVAMIAVYFMPGPTIERLSQ